MRLIYTSEVHKCITNLNLDMSSLPYDERRLSYTQRQNEEIPFSARKQTTIMGFGALLICITAFVLQTVSN